MTSKQELISELISRMEAAHASGAHFESAWYSYALLEDRMLSILRSSGGDKHKGDVIRMLGPKIKEISARIGNGPGKNDVLALAVNVKRAKAWSSSRNSLMHALADGTRTTQQIDQEAHALASEGIELVREVSASARRLKRHLRKQAAPPRAKRH